MTPDVLLPAALLLIIFYTCVCAWKALLSRSELALSAWPQACSWGFIGVVLTIGCYIAATCGFLLAARLALGWEFDPSAVDALAKERSLWLNSLAELLAVLASTLLISRGPLRFTLTPIGWTLSNALADIRLALLVGAAVLPIIYMVQFLVTQLPGMQYKHPFITMLLESDRASLWAAVTVSAVIVAPVAEEYFFRAMLQGWFESLLSRAVPEPQPVVAEGECEQDTPPHAIAAKSPWGLGILRYAPILGSST
ncbi:MAG: hypothetical protein ABGX05_15060, partial [Pirellulaceae bacterium]